MVKKKRSKPSGGGPSVKKKRSPVNRPAAAIAVPARGEPASAWRLAVAVVVAATLLRLLIAWRLPLVPDEAYYWVWSERLDAGYFDHPPGIAYLIRMGTLLLGDGTLGVRLGPIAAGTVTALATIGIARRLAGGQAALIASIVGAVLPLAAAGLVLATPDAPLLAAVACALYTIVRALEHPPRSSGSTGWWAAAGVALGIGFLAKYTAVILPAGVLLAFAIHPPLRARLREPGPYLASAIAILLFLPVVLWNARHDWISFAFQVRHGMGEGDGPGVLQSIGWVLEMLGGQLGLASPILFVLMAIVTWRIVRARPSDAVWTLAIASLFLFGFFVFSATRARVEPNWPAPAYVGGIALLAVASLTDRLRKWLRAGVALAGAMTAAIYLHALIPLLPIPPGDDPMGQAFGWDVLAARALQAGSSPPPGDGAGVWIAADRYQDAAELAWSMGDADAALALNLVARPNQYDLWDGFPDLARPGDRLVVALDETEGPHPVARLIAPHFQLTRRGELVELRRGDSIVATRRLWIFTGWRGSWEAAAAPAPS